LKGKRALLPVVSQCCGRALAPRVGRKAGRRYPTSAAGSAATPNGLAQRRDGFNPIEVVARDRGGGYALATAQALPRATQVADRWHLMENASRAFLDAVRKSMRRIRGAIGAATINPNLLTAAERIQYEGYLRREEANAIILGLVEEGVTIKEIVRRTGHSRGLVRRVLRGQRSDVFRVRESSLELHLQWLDKQLAAGQRNGTDLWRRLKKQGFRGCLRAVTEWTSRRRRAEKTDGALKRWHRPRTSYNEWSVHVSRRSCPSQPAGVGIEGANASGTGR
jgi:transposase